MTIKLKKKIKMQHDLIIYVLAGLLDNEDFLYYEENEENWKDLQHAVKEATKGNIKITGDAISFNSESFIKNKDKTGLTTAIEQKGHDGPIELYLHIDKYGYITHIEVEDD